MRKAAIASKYADLFYQSSRALRLRPKTALANKSTETWARGIIEQAFERAMGRKPSLAEAQLAQAVASIESGYGRGWSTSGSKSSHNWGAVQNHSTNPDPSKTFKHEDSNPGTTSAKTEKYMGTFEAYPDDVSGAAHMISVIFKSNRPQHKITNKTSDRQLPVGGPVAGPNRGELCLQAAANGDIMAFSNAMYHTGYYGGVGPNFSARIKTHANGLNNKIASFASALGEPQAATLKTTSTLPTTTDQQYLNFLTTNFPESAAGVTPSPGTPATVVAPPSGNNTERASAEQQAQSIAEMSGIL